MTLKQGIKRELKPKVRFPEFWNAPGWENEAMGEVYSFKGTNSFSRDQLNYENGIVKNIHYGDIHTKYPSSFDICREKVPFINPSESLETIRPDNYCVEGDMIFADASEDLEDVGKSIEIVALNDERLLSGMHTILARQRRKILIIGFGGHLFKSARIRNQIKKEAQGAKVFGVSPTRLSNIEICYPPEKVEQQKIATCLTSLDELIAAHSQKLDALKIHKKGLMQQLFPGEGEIIPRLRFSEFRKAKVWTKRKVSEVLSKVSMPITVEDKTLYREIGVRSHGKGIFHKEPITGTAIGEKRVFRVVEDALVLNIVFAWEQAVATTSKKETGMIASHRFPMYVAKSETCDVRFVKNAFLTPQGKHLLGVASPGGAGRNRTLGQEEFEHLSITLPDKEEQTKIADAIHTADDLITSQAVEVETLKRHKKGLLQQLFPSPEEVEA